MSGTMMIVDTNTTINYCKEVILKKEEFQLSVRTLNLMIKMGHTNLKSVVKNLQKKSKKSKK
jgi:hypothetical protein